MDISVYMFTSLAVLVSSGWAHTGSHRPEMIRIIPDALRVPNLLTFSFLQCEIEPFNVSDDLEPGWRLPTGDFLTRFNDTDDMRVSDIALSARVNSTTDAFILTLRKLSYQLAGMYSCEVRDPTAPGEPTIATAQVELQLNVTLRTDLGAVHVVNETAGKLELSCEMTLYAREDEDLQWFRRGLLITSGIDKHTVTYRDGEPDAAQRGGTSLIPGRVAVLTISNPDKHDLGTYTCVIAGTDQSIEFQLTTMQKLITVIRPAVFPRVPKLLTFALLQCEIYPSDVIDNLETGWRLPSGDFLTRDNDTEDMLVWLSNSSNFTTDLFALVLMNVSYRLAGNYSCELRDPTASGEPFATEQVELQLPVVLETDLDTVLIFNDTESDVELSCEMTFYAREDEDLQWFREGQLITSGTNRHTVSYRDGEPDVAQRGGATFIPGRVTAMTISSPETGDSGTYTCAVAGTNKSINFQLSITNGERTGGDSRLPAIIGATAGVLGLVMILLLAVVIIVSLRKRINAPFRAAIELNDPLNDIPEPPLLSATDIPAQRQPKPANVIAPTLAELKKGGYSNPHQAELEKDGYSDPNYYDQQPLSSATDTPAQRQPNPAYVNTPSWAELEKDGYSDPRYYGPEPRSSATDVPAQRQPNPAYVNTPSRAELEKDGYSDPRYYGQEQHSPATKQSNPTFVDTPSQAELEKDGYSDPCQEEHLPATAQLKPNPAYVNTPSRTELEKDGYSDPRYYGPEPHSSATAQQGPNPAYVNTPSRTELEKGGYSDPRYCGEQSTKTSRLRASTNTYPAPEQAQESSYFNTPSRDELKRDGYSDPRYYHEQGTNESSPAAAINPYAVSEQAPESTYVNTPSRDELEKDGYSDPRYYGDH